MSIQQGQAVNIIDHDVEGSFHNIRDNGLWGSDPCALLGQEQHATSARLALMSPSFCRAHLTHCSGDCSQIPRGVVQTLSLGKMHQKMVCLGMRMTGKRRPETWC